MSLLAAWQARTSRERTALALGAVAVTALLFYGFAWEPWRVQQARLRDYLPRLRAQAAQFSVDVAEAARLRAQVRTAPSGEHPRSAIESAAAATGVRAQLKSIAEVPAGRFQVTLDPVPYDAFIRWAGALAAQAVTVESVELRAGAAPGTVTVVSLVVKSRGAEQ